MIVGESLCGFSFCVCLGSDHFVVFWSSLGQECGDDSPLMGCGHPVGGRMESWRGGGGRWRAVEGGGGRG